MRPGATFLVGTLLVPFVVTFAAAADDPIPITAYVPQTPRVSMECFPDPLRIILADLGKQFGKQVVVTSGHRTTRKTRKRSQHRTCKAADIRIHGVRPSTVAKAAKAHPLIGGVGTYCGRNGGIVHVDVGPPRTWHYCGKRRARRG